MQRPGASAWATDPRAEPGAQGRGGAKLPWKRPAPLSGRCSWIEGWVRPPERDLARRFGPAVALAQWELYPIRAGTRPVKCRPSAAKATYHGRRLFHAIPF